MASKFFTFLLSLLFVTGSEARSIRTDDFQQSLSARAVRNYVKNSGAENNSAVNVSASGGTLSVTGSSPLKGDYSFTVDASSSGQTYTWAADDFQGELLGQNCVASFKYSGDGSLYKVSAKLAGVLSSAEYQLSDSGSVTNSVSVPFPCGASSTNDPTVVIESTSASAAAIVVDDVFIGIWDGVVSEPIMTDWANYTPVFSASLGTVTNIAMKWRRVGDSVQIRGRFTAGTTSASVAQIGLPSGLTISSNVAALETAGTATANNAPSTTAFSTMITIQPSLTYVNLSITSSTVNADNFANGNVYGNNISFSLNAIVPVAGWSSNQSSVSISAPGMTWTSYTPTISYSSGAMSNVTHSFKYKCVDPITLAVEGTSSFSGTSSAYSTPRYSLPTGATYAGTQNNWSGYSRGVSTQGATSAAVSDGRLVPVYYAQSAPSTDTTVSTAGYTNTIVGSSGQTLEFGHFSIPIAPGFCPASQAAYVKQGIVYDTTVRAEGLIGINSIANGTTTPTPLAITNVSAVSAASCQYQRAGKIVNVSCRVPLTCTTGASTSTTVDIPLPIASNLSATGDLNGVIGQNPSLADGGGICIEDTTNDRASCTFACSSTNALAGRRVLFQYEVK